MQGAALDRECKLLSRLADEIRAQVAGSTDDWILVLEKCDFDVLALVTLDTLFHSIMRRYKGHKACIRLGRAAHGEAWAAKLLIDDEALHRRIGKIHDARGRAAAAKKAGYRSKEWTEEQAFLVGNWLIDCCLCALPDIFVTLRAGRNEVVIDVREEAKELADKLTTMLIGCNPVLVPCTSLPKPWTGWRDGGYQDERTRASVTFVKGKAARNKDTEREFKAAFRNGSMKQHVDAVNSLQSVAYRINEPVLAALKRYGPRLLEADFAKRAQDQQGKKLKKLKRQLKQDRLQLERDLAVADSLKGAPFYIPLNIDFRGRVYPIPPFNYQREDHIRALFLFDCGEPIGSEQSIRRLKDHVASRWGLDKAKLPDRRQWCDENRDLIERTARLESDDWLKRKKPFAFLAACIELVAARDGGPAYETRLPVSFDGNCNGLMHFCALTRQDPLGMMTECATSEAVVDPYEEVADQWRPVFDDNWPSLHITVDRGLVKSPTQTFFYGVSKLGMARQLREVLEERGDTLPADPKQAGTCLYKMGEEVRAVIEDLIPGAKQTMDFLWGWADVLAKRGKILQGTSPTGVPWANRYHKYKTKRVRSLLGGTSVRPKIVDGYEAGIRVKKSRDAASANFVHSLDASHLALTVNAGRHANMADILAIHDSYSCLAPRAKQLNSIVREQFVAMYEQHDPLTEIRESALQTLRIETPAPSQMAEALAPLAAKGKRVAKAVATQLPDLPKVPTRGDLDLNKFTKNVYSFS
jgi:DNA-directed RNA polymerase